LPTIFVVYSYSSKDTYADVQVPKIKRRPRFLLWCVCTGILLWLMGAKGKRNQNSRRTKNGAE